ncbi:hypothetical protein AALO_G00210610 [Alosa alosa]|uniref:C2H2-type domain-containing protein n=1 Tax=Alosa alosa TaxID=278164 RepID=A0AAV6G3X6_9TELE|nr:hypothetical protein AALO_G00210610 [Alosa alosa]
MKSQEVKTPNSVKSLSDMRPVTPMKSLQFRSIAPKAPPPPPPLVSDAPKPSGAPMLVPTQNYALMQVAGREGTFSWCRCQPLPPLSPPQQPISKSLKLPIPRYQPMRSKGTPEKAGNSKTSGSPAKVAMTPARSVAAASAIQSKASEVANTPTEPANEPLVFAGEAGLVGKAGPILGSLAPKPTAVAMPTPELTPPTCQVKPEKVTQPITVLSPALFGKAVQLVTPSPSGKLPILPYSRVRDSLLASRPEKPSPSASAAPGSRKYRSIRPKPAPGAALPLQLSSSSSSSSSSSTSPSPPLQTPLSLPLHPCPTCGRCFQHKHHLTAHLTTSHLLLANRGKAAAASTAAPAATEAGLELERGHARPVRRVRCGPLGSTRVRPRPLLRCLFCQKAFSYVGVFFSHLRELHRVILTVEPSIAQHEEHTPGTELCEEDMEDPVELQIKCGRCQAVTPTFSDMQLHLLYVHGQSAGPGPSGGGPTGGGGSDGRTVEEELVKHAAHYWRQLNERRALRRCGRCQEVFLSASRLKRHACGRRPGGAASAGLRTGRGVHCFLCSVVLDSKQEVLEHWRGRHYCENPPLLWDALNEGVETDGRSVS